MLVRTCTLVFLLCAAGAAQEGYYQFEIDQDRLSGAPDFSDLNQTITAADRLFVRNGHFFRVGPDLVPGTADDERVRLFGVNLSFGGNFPAERDAARIAKRLRRLGINLVRLHHMDSSPDANPNDARSILTQGPYPSFNPVTMVRLRAFLEALKAEGVYINLNLHVGYRFRPSVDQLPYIEEVPTQSKPLQVLYPRLVELQMEYTRGLIHNLRLEDEPVLAMVEINNESSLLQAFQQNQLDSYLIGEYREVHERQWNRYLRYLYRSTEELRTAWGASTPDGTELLTMGWQLEKGSPSNGNFEVTGTSPELVRVVITSQGPRLNF